MSEPFIAEIRIFAGNFAPRGWAFCNGQLLPISQNTALFSLIGTTYGGDGRTTTALPNLQGCAPMHPGNGPGLTSRRLGQRGGAETITLTEAQMPQHQHSAVGSTTDGKEEKPAGHSGVADYDGSGHQDAAAGGIVERELEVEGSVRRQVGDIELSLVGDGGAHWFSARG